MVLIPKERDGTETLGFIVINHTYPAAGSPMRTGGSRYAGRPPDRSVKDVRHLCEGRTPGPNTLNAGHPDLDLEETGPNAIGWLPRLSSAQIIRMLRELTTEALWGTTRLRWGPQRHLRQHGGKSATLASR